MSEAKKVSISRERLQYLEFLEANVSTIVQNAVYDIIETQKKGHKGQTQKGEAHVEKDRDVRLLQEQGQDGCGWYYGVVNTTD